MKTNKYLYNISDLSYLLKLNYKEAIEIKINLAKTLLTKLVRDENMQDDERIKAVQKAINFNRQLLKLKD